MPTYIALFRGINVGGKNSLPMRDLVAALESLGLSDVKTYIQSGNAVFRAKSRSANKLGREISSAIEANHGFAPQVMVLPVASFRQAIEQNPFPQAQAEPKSLHLYFLDAAPKKPNLDRLAELQAETESFQIIDQVFYLHAPAGIGRSKLAAAVEKALGVGTTARNWRTVEKILELAEQVSA